MAVDRSQPFAWWGPPEWGSPEPMSIPQLIEAGDLDTRLAALFWCLMDRRASMIIGAMPRLAGKTTLLTALLDFLGPQVRRIYLRGQAEGFDFLDRGDPSNSYLLVNELSDHLPYYLWGPQARQALALLVQGYGLAATMHADSPEEVMGLLEGELGVSRSTLGHLTVVVNLEMGRSPQGHDDQPIRRVRAVTLIQPAGGALVYTPLAHWESSPGDRFVIEENAVEAIAGRLRLDPQALTGELAAREEHLCAVLENGLAEPQAFRQAVLAHRV